jgi:hypothetical protein
MTLNNYLLVMTVLTITAWTIFLFVASIIDPSSTNWLGFTLFYFSLFLSLSGLAILIGFIIRFIVLKKELAFNLVKVAFRQSFLFALFFVIALFLKANNLFNWLNLLLLVLIFSIFELFLISYKKAKR